METYNTFLPVFSGFYGNCKYEFDEHQIIDFIHERRDENKLNPLKNGFDLDIDYTKFYSDISKKLCSDFERQFNMECEESKIKITFKKLGSPREYNFRNDVIDCDIECDIDTLLKICNENLNTFADYIERIYTSRSGFISLHSADIDDWLDIDYINENTEHRVGAILDFLCTSIYDICEPYLYDLNIDEYEYITNLDELLTKFIYKDEMLYFNDIENFEKGCFWFRNFSDLRKENYHFDNINMSVQFVDTTNGTINQLENSPLIDFEYTLCELELV
jgi:hypothetical protein